jgi:hypothetical protein
MAAAAVCRCRRWSASATDTQRAVAYWRPFPANFGRHSGVYRAAQIANKCAADRPEGREVVPVLPEKSLRERQVTSSEQLCSDGANEGQRCAEKESRHALIDTVRTVSAA